MISVKDCKIISLHKITNSAGNIIVVNGQENIGFNIKRVFYLYDIPGGADRGAHSHKECHQFLVATSGSFDVELDDGFSKKTINLNQPYEGLYIPPGIWAAEKRFASSSICLVLASHKYDESDYIRDYKSFLAYKS
tara:strand:- start:17442 stop:17849 length:408 start_codon:yes stop_codon:yes gene_type:complete